VAKAHQRNHRESLKRGFADKVVAEILASKAEVLRVHASGDFYSAAYARKWLKVVKRVGCERPGLRFFGYTRSWRTPEVRPVLALLAMQPNVRLWLSWDRDTGPPPLLRRTRRAYMAVNDRDRPSHATHLVFRVRRETVMKYEQKSGALCCPVEQHVHRKVAITCSTCQLCWQDNPPPRSPRLRRRDAAVVSAVGALELTQAASRSSLHACRAASAITQISRPAPGG
jgi:hypothetical protein